MTAMDEITQALFNDDAAEKPRPMAVFSAWLEQAKTSEINDANAMVLATVDAEGMPDCRTMLLNGLDGDGFVFFTNTRSAKGRQLLANPYAALLFHWKSVRRQVRIRGGVTQVSDDVADTYFQSRPRGSQIGAHASLQSQPLARRKELETRVEELTAEFDGQIVPRPRHWTGFKISPLYMEFWQDGEFRLHDRVAYRRADSAAPWASERLNP